jgi:hypothetical protein
MREFVSGRNKLSRAFFTEEGKKRPRTSARHNSTIQNLDQVIGAGQPNIGNDC